MLLATVCLKLLFPAVGKTVAEWFIGEESNSVNHAVACFRSAVSGGAFEAVEVFCDALLGTD